MEGKTCAVINFYYCLHFVYYYCYHYENVVGVVVDGGGAAVDDAVLDIVAVAVAYHAYEVVHDVDVDDVDVIAVVVVEAALVAAVVVVVVGDHY